MEPRFNFYKGNYDAMRLDLSKVNWNEIKSPDVSTFWNKFSEELLLCSDIHIPKSVPSRSKKKPWINRDAMNAIQEKTKAWKRYLACRSKIKIPAIFRKEKQINL